MRSSNNSRAPMWLLVVAAVNPPALMETRILPQQAASVHPFPPLHPISASPHPLVWILRSLHPLLGNQYQILWLVKDSGAAATTVMTPVQVHVSPASKDNWFDCFVIFEIDLCVLNVGFNVLYILTINMCSHICKL